MWRYYRKDATLCLRCEALARRRTSNGQREKLLEADPRVLDDRPRRHERPARIRLINVRYEWLPSFDAIPEVSWEPLVQIERGKLRGLDARPRVERMQGFDGRTYDRVEWLTPAGTGLSEESGSPAALHKRKLEFDPEAAPRAIAKAISEMLALPGTRSDYHFGMLSAWSALHGARRHDPRAFGWIEALCLADISLMEQGPELVFAEDHWSDLEERGGYPVVPAFHQLSSLYQREGFLTAAVDIEKRCAALGASRPVGEEAIARYAALLEEDGR